jgi:hypothetical protein
MQVVQADTLQVAIDKVKELKPQIVFVKTYSEARMLADLLGAVAWWSRASEEAKTTALEHLENGGMLVSTYGLSVGLNLTVRGKCIEIIVLFGCPWGLSALVQAASRIRYGGTAYVIACDLKEQATSGKPGEKELAALLLPGYIDEIFDAFGTAVTVPRSVTAAKPTPNYQDCRADAMVVQGMQLDGTIDECILCGGSDHCEANCQIMRGLCFTCGFTGHPAKSCPMVTKVPICPTGFCTRCKLPIFKVAGVEIHSKSIGMDCNNTALAQKVKMMLLCGRARGVQVGPSGSSTYFERLRWAMQDSPPNIVTLLARVADKKPILATQTSPVTPQQRSATPVSTPLQGTVTPPTMQRHHKQASNRFEAAQQQQETNRDRAAAIAISRAIGQLPQVVISEQEWENAGRVKKAMFAASCCSSCALPTCKPFGINLHPQTAGALCRNSKMLMLKVIEMPSFDFNRAFTRGWSPAILHVLANWLAEAP